MTDEVVCLRCIHFFMDTGWAGTEVTPGDGMTMACALSKWAMDTDYEGEGELRGYMEMASGCDEYEDYRTVGA